LSYIGKKQQPNNEPPIYISNKKPAGLKFNAANLPQRAAASRIRLTETP
jgi:hypothetical protein